jgi:prepilin-type N-terminal cleavage/methylation domain-containing protein
MKNDQKGFTVLELLIAVFMGGIVTAAAMSIYITEHKQLLVQDSITDAQSSLRAAWSYGNYYTAPNRDWAFDPDLLVISKLPPGTPPVNIVVKSQWHQSFGD